MSHLLIPGLIITSAAIVGCFWLCWQLLRQNGRMLLRLEELESRFDGLEFAKDQEPAEPSLDSPSAGSGKSENENQRHPTSSSADNGSERANRFKNHSLARSKIKRDGLKAGTPAPDFRLPLLDGRGELSLGQLRGQRVIMVFSSPCCAPCNELAPKLEKFHREEPELELVMVSRGEPTENRAKVKEHGLSFPVALQQGWEVSRLYAIFATPAAYLIDQEGVVAHDVAVGGEPILNLLASIAAAKAEIIR
jgi:peroxiredoxin